MPSHYRGSRLRQNQRAGDGVCEIVMGIWGMIDIVAIDAPTDTPLKAG
jgi:hypothetical protein